jgi:predicted nicotinamide N-methyase
VSERELQRLEAKLREQFQVVETEIDIADRTLRVLHPASAEDLIDEAAFEHDERLPYWAELWPSARVLAEHVATLAGTDRTLIELGCGAGLVSTAACVAGFTVTASDYYEDATRFARVNAWRNTGCEPRPLVLDWRHMPATASRHDVVLASDVLYERPYGALVARVIAATIAPRGIAYVADPGRVARADFLASLPPLGLALRSQANVPYADGEVRQTIAIFEISARR